MKKLLKRTGSVMLAAAMLLSGTVTVLPQTVNTTVTADAAFIAATGWMNECKPYQYNGVTEYLSSTEDTFKVAGNEYKEGCVFYNWYQEPHMSQVLYDLDGKYDSFSFDFAKVDGTTAADTTMTIYIDGVMTDKVDFSASSAGKRVEIPLNGAKHLKLFVQHHSHEYDVYYAMFNGEWVKNGTEGTEPEKSVWLSKSAPYELSNTEVFSTSENKSLYMGGKAYTDALQFYMWNGTYSKAYAQFNLNGRYDNFSFTLGHVDSTTRVQGTLTVKLDGKIVQTIKAEADDLPEKFTVPVSGAKQLTLEMYSDSAANVYNIYYGIGEANFTKNTPDSISDCLVTLDSETFTYNGTEAKPEVTVTDGLYTLAKDVDYEIQYQNNVNAGIAAAVIKGIGDYTGTTEKTYIIRPENLSADAIGNIPEQIYSGEAAEPELTVSSDNKKLVENTDYTVSYSNNETYGTATATVTGIGNYIGSASKTFKIYAEAPTAVKLSKTTAEVIKGKILTLTVTITPNSAYVKNKTVTWSSSDKNIATVDANGKITAKSAGTATITLKTANGKTAKCKVTVKNPTVAASSVKLSKTSLTLTKGNKQTIKATVNPNNTTNKTVKWSTSNSKVATVSSTGKITAKGAGTATITVTTANNKKATCKVTVKNFPTKVRLNKTSATLKVKKNLTLKASVTPSKNVISSITWTSSNKKIATVKNGKVTAKKAGTVTITAKTVNGKTAKCKIKVTK